MKLDALFVRFKFSGTDVQTDALRVRIVEGLSELFEVDAVLTLPRADLAKLQPGNECDVFVVRGLDDANLRPIHGIIRSAEQLDEGDGRDLERPLVHITIVPRVWRTSLSRHTRVFEKVSIDDAIKKVLAESGLEAFDGQADPSTQHPLLVQYDETDLDFMSRLLEDAGVTHFVEQTGTKDKWVLVDADANKTRLGQPRSLVWSVRTEGQADEEGVLRAGRRDGMGSTAFKTTDTDRREGTQAVHGQAKITGSFTREWREPWSLGAKKTTDLAKQLLDEGRVERQSYWLETNDIQLRAGEVLDAELSQGDAVAGTVTTLLVARVEHEIETGEDQIVYRNRVEAVSLEKPFRPARVTPRPTILAPQTGTVKSFLPTNNLEIEVLMDWNAEQLVIPVRVPQPIAGKNHGAVMLPHIGTEVLVHFIDGVPERPVLLGALYNMGIPTPVNPKEKPYTTHLAMLGDRGTTNTIDVDDNTNGSEKTTMVVINDVDVTVGRDELWTVKGNVTEDLKKDVKVDVGGKRTSAVVGDEQYKTDGAVTITVAKTGRVQVNQSLQMTADTKLSLISGNTRADFSPSAAKITVGGAVIEMSPGSIKLTAAGATIEIGPTIKITAPLVSINNGALDVV